MKSWTSEQITETNAGLRDQSPLQRRARVRSQEVEGSGLNGLTDRPINRTVKDRWVIVIHAKDKTGVHLCSIACS